MEIGELGLDIWRIFMIQNLGDILVKQILQGIERDRVEGNLTPRDIETINGDILSFVMVQDYKKKGNLKLYENIFEGKMLEASGDYFRSQASKLLQTCSVSQYMQEVIKILEEENIRAHKFMHMTSIQKLKKECEDRMITDHKTFLYSECKDMVSNDKRDDLKNLYTLLKPIADGLKELIQFLLEQIKNEGTESVMNLKGDNVSSLFDQCLNSCRICFALRSTSNSSKICSKFTKSTKTSSVRRSRTIRCSSAPWTRRVPVSSTRSCAMERRLAAALNS
jgi:cullin 2